MSFFAVLGFVLLLPTLALADCTTPAGLATLLNADADTIGFAAPIAAGRDGVVLRLANAPQSGAAYRVQRGVIPSYEVVAVYDRAEYQALTDHALQELTSLLSPGFIDMSSQSIQDILFSGPTPIFPATGTTKAMLVALIKSPGSWALRRCGRALTLTDISDALHPAGG
jgi:hypothetical protein